MNIYEYIELNYVDPIHEWCDYSQCPLTFITNEDPDTDHGTICDAVGTEKYVTLYSDGSFILHKPTIFNDVDCFDVLSRYTRFNCDYHYHNDGMRVLIREDSKGNRQYQLLEFNIRYDANGNAPSLGPINNLFRLIDGVVWDFHNLRESFEGVVNTHTGLLMHKYFPIKTILKRKPTDPTFNSVLQFIHTMDRIDHFSKDPDESDDQFKTETWLIQGIAEIVDKQRLIQYDKEYTYLDAKTPPKGNAKKKTLWFSNQLQTEEDIRYDRQFEQKLCAATQKVLIYHLWKKHMKEDI